VVIVFPKVHAKPKPIVWFLTNLDRAGTVYEFLFYLIIAAMKANDQVRPEIVHQDFLTSVSKMA
jgi:hypothetical protein